MWINEKQIKNIIKKVISEKKTKLNLNGNNLHSLPPEIGEMTNLQLLSLENNELQYIPPEIGNLTKLKSLFISNNQLSSLPPQIGNLNKLQSLLLNGNQLRTLPKEIGRLTSLQFLSLAKNKLKSLPQEIGKLTNLRTLVIGDNPLETPPIEVATKGIDAIMNYFIQMKSEGKDFIYEAKLLVVGEAGAGKTSLANKIVKQDYELQEEESTRGIDVIKWTFPIENDRKFNVNIWDFGGQEIYHATHQFFLTKRSLYILVADTRKEDTDFYYWLNVVELLSDNSPLLIVKNEKQDRHFEINERQLRGEFTNYKDTLTTNLATNRGMKEILASIKSNINRLPHIGNALPKTWVIVRKELERDSRNYISVNEYLDICHRNGFNRIDDKLQLSEYLHDLGICLHFQDDPLLKKIIILKPEWGTRAVYKVLDNERVINNSGRFSRNDLEGIWYEQQYEEMHDELLQLMIKFKLCYKVPTKQDLFIAPQLLKKNQPDYEWVDTNNLNLKYTYEFMPKGITSQLIVVLHQFILEQKYVWRNGVILEKDKTKAEVIEHYEKREIKIRAIGEKITELIAIILYELDNIHNSYHKRLKVKKWVPCICPVCKNNQNPNYFEYDTLSRTAYKNERIQCYKSFEMLDPRELIYAMVGKKRFTEDKEKKEGIVIEGNVEKFVFQQNKREITNVMKEKMSQDKVVNVGKKTNISKPIVMADKIEDSFNKIKKENEQNDIKMLLEQLLKAVNEVNKKVPPEKIENAKEMARNTEILVKETKGFKPRRRRYKNSIKKIKRTAVQIGKVAAPVISIVEKLLQIILP